MQKPRYFARLYKGSASRNSQLCKVDQGLAVVHVYTADSKLVFVLSMFLPCCDSY